MVLAARAPHSINARRERARGWVAAGRFAIGALSIASLFIGAPEARAQPARTAAAPGLAEASRALSAGDLDSAFRLATDYLKRRPGDVRAQLLLVRVHVERDEWERAYLIANRAVLAHPDNVDALYYLGLVTRQLAVDQLERLVRVAPDSARVHQLQAETLEVQERNADAEKEYAAALEAKPDLLKRFWGWRSSNASGLRAKKQSTRMTERKRSSRRSTQHTGWASATATCRTTSLP